jgi:GntR family transcriptional regulator
MTIESLASKHGVSPETVYRAARELEANGAIEIRHGSGIYTPLRTPFLRHSPRRLARDQWDGGGGIQAADTGGRPVTVDRISIERQDQPETEAEALGPAPAVVRRRRYNVAGRPVQVATSWLPASIAAGTAIEQEDTGPGGIYARLAELGHAPARYHEDIRCRMPEPDEASDLELPRGRPVIEITRHAFTAQGRIVEINIMVLDASAYVLGYDVEA